MSACRRGAPRIGRYDTMTLRCCIFDLDGVLVDTARYHYLAWARLARGLGFEFPPACEASIRGLSRMDSLEVVLRAGGMERRFAPEERERLAAEKNAFYLESVAAMTPAEVLPGCVEFLRSLRGRGIGLVLGSSSKNAGLVLDRTGLRPLFDDVVDGTHLTRAKPDPEVFLLGASRVGAEPAQCVVFEDAAAGIEAAHRAGIRCVGVGTGAATAAAELRIASFADFTPGALAAGLDAAGA